MQNFRFLIMRYSVDIMFSAVGALLLSIAANLITPFVKDFLSRRSVARTKKRIRELEGEIQRLKTESLPHFWAFGMRAILRTLICIAGSLAFYVSNSDTIGSIGGSSMLLMSAFIALKDYKQLRPYDDIYRNSIVSRIEALQKTLPIVDNPAPPPPNPSNPAI